MNAECAREPDVLDMLAANRWPSKCEQDLKEHVETCAACAGLLIVASALLDEHESAWAEARVPPPALVWWRAQVRGREEAARAAARPIAFVQGIAASCAVWIAVSLLRAFPPPVPDWHAWFATALNALPDVAAVAAAVPGGVPFLVVAVASLLLSSLVLFFALREDSCQTSAISKRLQLACSFLPPEGGSYDRGLLPASGFRLPAGSWSW